MKTVVFPLLATIAGSSLAADPFRNLNFEASFPNPPVVPDDPYQRVDITRALPGWNGFTGDRSESGVSINNIFLDSAGLSLFSKTVSGPLDFSSSILQGNRSVLLQAGVQLFDGPIVSASLSQTGTLSASTRSILFLAGTDHSPFSVSLNGSAALVYELAQTESSAMPSYKTYGVDVAAYAGLDVDLKFTAAPSADSGHGWLVLDDIRLSPATVPEPGSWALLGCGIGGLGWELRRRAFRQR